MQYDNVIKKTNWKCVKQFQNEVQTKDSKAA